MTPTEAGTYYDIYPITELTGTMTTLSQHAWRSARLVKNNLKYIPAAHFAMIVKLSHDSDGYVRALACCHDTNVHTVRTYKALFAAVL